MKVLHFWSKGRHVGDFFYARAQQNLLRELLGDVEIWESACGRHLPGDDGITREALMQPADLVIVGGGPLYGLKDYPGSLVFSEADMQACDKPVLVWSTGLDRQMRGSPVPLDSVHALHSKAKSAAVRDRGTRAWLRGLGYESTVTGDASHFLVEPEPVKHRKGPVLFSWRQDLCELLADTVKGWLEWAESQGLEAKLVCLADGDAESAEKLGFPYFYAEQEVEKYVAFIGSASAVLGCRMHAAILALIQGVPAHCFYASSRIKWWGDDFFRLEWLLPLFDMTVGSLTSITEELLSGNLSIFQLFTERVQELRLQTKQWLLSEVL